MGNEFKNSYQNEIRYAQKKLDGFRPLRPTGAPTWLWGMSLKTSSFLYFFLNRI